MPAALVVIDEGFRSGIIALDGVTVVKRVNNSSEVLTKPDAYLHNIHVYCFRPIPRDPIRKLLVNK